MKVDENFDEKCHKNLEQQLEEKFLNQKKNKNKWKM